MNFNITVTLTKIAALVTLFAGALLSWKYGDSIYFITGSGALTLLAGGQNLGNSLKKKKQ